MESGQMVLSVVSFILAVMLTAHGQQFDCSNYKTSDPCTLDAIPHCLTNGTIVTGKCHAKRAVCLEGKTIDETFAACEGRDKFNCQSYNPMVCPRDAISFCLKNGTLLIGSCAARRAVCRENQEIDEHFTACNRRTGDSGDGDNGASSFSAGAALLLTPSLFLLRF